MPDTDAHAAATYDAMAEDYHAALARGEKHYNSLYERPAVISMLPDISGKSVLDVGCGTGPLSAWLASRGAEVVGFDTSAQMVRIAEERGIERSSFRVADLAQPLSFLTDNSFDVAVASLVMHYLYDWVEPLRELRRVLRPSGRLIISTHHPARDIELSATGNYFGTELVRDRWKLGEKEFDVQFWRRPLTDMFAAFAHAGFNVLEFHEPQPVPECRELSPEAWQALTTRPTFAFFKLAPADRFLTPSDA
jgi:SAM-dependent methyltransferase